MVKIAFFFLFSFSIMAQSLDGLKLIGTAQMNWMFFRLYKIEYFATPFGFNQKYPYALRLSYQRSLSGKLISEKSGSEMKRFLNDEEKVKNWVKQLENIIPDVDEKTIIAVLYDPQVGTRFFKENQLMGKIEGEDFGKYFFSIWLDEKSSEPNLRLQLLNNQTGK